jgi:DNA helicase-2/ATP-dependent DNA helicase PcrA
MAEPAPTPAAPAAGLTAAVPAAARPAGSLTAEQRRIVEWEDGPLVVIAGAGTGKTRVIVERVRRLLETKGAPAAEPDAPGASARDSLVLPAEAAEAGRSTAAAAGPSTATGPGTATGPSTAAVGAATAKADYPFAGPLLPEQVLVLTYNVKAARELAERLEAALGPAARARLAVSNFHSFCHRILSESAPDAGLPSQPDVLDGVGQVLLLRDIRPRLPLRYYAGTGPNDNLGRFVGFINRAKDELVSPADFEAFVAREQAAFEARFGPYALALERLERLGAFDRGQKDTRVEYASFRRAERAAEAGDSAASPDFEKVEKVAEREARRTVIGTGGVVGRDRLTGEQREAVDRLAATYVADGAALEVLRLGELALVYRAYEEERERRGALDFGEQIAAVIRLFRERPNVLRRWQRRFRYLLVDEFQDANIAQIELVELVGRTPDRPANVMVVGDDDQSIYRFRGASYAAFVELDRRLSGPPAHDPAGSAPGPPPRLRIEENFRSRPPILAVANRLIARNRLRYEPDKRLVPHRGGRRAPSVELWTCADPDDEAAAIVERIRAVAAWDPAVGGAPAVPWSSFAILYRKHKHREAIVARLREESIPYTVSGGLSLFAAPEIRDLEQALRMLADPFADVAAARVLTAGPWRLDALELLALARAAKRAERHLLELARDAAGTGAVTIDAVAGVSVVIDEPTAAADRPSRILALAPATRAKLRRFLATLDELVPQAPREGPFTLLERWLERTSGLRDLLAADTLEAKRAVANIASLMRFAADWQREHPARSLPDFVDYLDAYQSAGGELPTSVELAEDVQGVRLMTLYQAKGLEYDHVFVPHLLAGEWPVAERDWSLFPRELLREAVPVGDLHTEEERRLLYVAITRARELAVLITHVGTTVQKEPSLFVGEIRDGAGPELVEIDRTATPATAPGLAGRVGRAGGGTEAAGGGTEAAGGVTGAATDDEDGDGSAGGAVAAIARIVALPSPRERRTALRLRAGEILTLLEGVAPSDPDAAAARAALVAELAGVGEAAAASADAARAAGLDPLTLRTVAADAGAGASLLAVAPLPAAFSYTQFDAHERCPALYAFRHVYRIPVAVSAPWLTFGSTAHAAFEAFTRERRERAAAGEPPPTREDLRRHFEAAWEPVAFADRTTEETYRRRADALLERFWEGEIASAGEALHEELDFELRLDPGDGSSAVVVVGQIDRIDRLPSGGIEVLDYKTGSPRSQKSVDESLQLSIYALACRDVLGLGTPERVTLYFTEAGLRMSTTRTDEQLDAARQAILARAARIRAGDFAATPSVGVCGRCDYRAICPSRAE